MASGPPVEFTLGEHTCTHRRLSAEQQFSLLRKLEPAFPALNVLGAQGAAVGGASALARALAPLRAMDDATLDAAVDACLGAVLGPPELLSLTPSEIMLLILEVFTHNFSAMVNMRRPVNAEADVALDRGYGPRGAATLPDGEDWLYAPLTSEPPLCTLSQLKDGTYRIEDVAKMNDILRVRSTNTARWHEANRQGP